MMGSRSRAVGKRSVFVQPRLARAPPAGQGMKADRTSAPSISRDGGFDTVRTGGTQMLSNPKARTERAALPRAVEVCSVATCAERTEFAWAAKNRGGRITTRRSPCNRPAYFWALKVGSSGAEANCSPPPNRCANGPRARRSPASVLPSLIVLHVPAYWEWLSCRWSIVRRTPIFVARPNYTAEPLLLFRPAGIATAVRRHRRPS